MRDIKEIIDVRPEDVHVETRAHVPRYAKKRPEYSHHEPYAAPELPADAVPYSSLKAKTLMLMFSFVLLTLTISLVQATQERVNTPSPERLAFEASINEASYLNKDISMFSRNTEAFESSLEKMGTVVKSRQALVEVETTLRKQRAGKQAVMSDKKARDLLLRAGYGPSSLDDARIAEFKKTYRTVDSDVNFARDIASDIVQEEVESFVHKMKIISNVGNYIYDRVVD